MTPDVMWMLCLKGFQVRERGGPPRGDRVGRRPACGGTLDPRFPATFQLLTPIEELSPAPVFTNAPRALRNIPDGRCSGRAYTELVRRVRICLLALVVAAAVATAGCGGNNAAAPPTTSATTGAGASVPFVVGLLEQDAVSKLQALGFQAVVVREHSAESAQTVTKQTPAAGSNAARGTPVRITVSTLARAS